MYLGPWSLEHRDLQLPAQRRNRHMIQMVCVFHSIVVYVREPLIPTVQSTCIKKLFAVCRSALLTDLCQESVLRIQRTASFLQIFAVGIESTHFLYVQLLSGQHLCLFANELHVVGLWSVTGTSNNAELLKKQSGVLWVTVFAHPEDVPCFSLVSKR